MEGLLDATLRGVLTHAGGVDRCVSEFIRVSGVLLPERTFRRIVPELDHGSRTAAGVPVRVQLLGSDPACMADNAARLASLGPEGVDLNFGCPAPTVNRHRGGAVLLDEPELVGRIVAAVRRAVPARLPVSAKMRLGNGDGSRALDCALAIAGGGAGELVVHARTRVDGYRPPAWWERIRPIREALAIPVVANGEIWTVADALRARERSGCEHLMLGRGMVADPGLALAVRAALTQDPGAAAIFPWARVLPLLHAYWLCLEERLEARHRPGRLKQWLFLLRRRHPEAEALWRTVRPLADPAEVGRVLARLAGAAPAARAAA